MKTESDGFKYDELIRVMDVFSGDKDLVNWFLSLQTMNDPARSLHLKGMADGMRTSRERPDLIAAVESLRSSIVFKSALKIVQAFDR